MQALCWWQRDQMSSCCQSSIRQAVSDQRSTCICPTWIPGSLPTSLRSRNMRGREQKFVLVMLWCIVSVTDLTAAMWNAAGSDTHIDTVGQLHSPHSPSASSVHPSSHQFRLTWNDILHVILRLQRFADGPFLICNAITNPKADIWNCVWTHRPPTAACWELAWLLFNKGLTKCLPQTSLLCVLLSNGLNHVPRTGFKNFNIAE